MKIELKKAEQIEALIYHGAVRRVYFKASAASVEEGGAHVGHE